VFNLLTRNVNYSWRTAPLTSKVAILCIYSTNIGTEYFKHGVYSPFFPSKCSLFHNSNVFSSCIIQILYTGCAKIKKNNSGAKRLIIIDARCKNDNFCVFYVLFVLCRSVYCLCVNVCCTAATGWQPSCSFNKYYTSYTISLQVLCHQPF